MISERNQDMARRQTSIRKYLQSQKISHVGMTQIKAKTLSYFKRKVLPVPVFQRTTNLCQHSFEMGGEVFEFNNGSYFRKVQTLSEGSIFGELALLSKGKVTRTATVKVCGKKAEFATLPKQKFKQYLLKITDV